MTKAKLFFRTNPNGKIRDPTRRSEWIYIILESHVYFIILWLNPAQYTIFVLKYVQSINVTISRVRSDIEFNVEIIFLNH